MSASENEPIEVDADEAPEIEDKPGPWDNILNSVILIAPWVAIVAALGYVIYTGSLSTDIVLTGEVPIQPFAYAGGALIAVTYLLALMKFYGMAPLAYIFKRAHNLATNYNPPDDN